MTFTSFAKEVSFIGLLLLVTHVYLVGTICSLPNHLQNSNWNDTRTNTKLIFGNTMMGGWNLKVRGTITSYFTCITNSIDVYVLRSDGQFYDFATGNSKSIYICLRMTEVTKNLFYFYILSDIVDTNEISPSQRLYIPGSKPSIDEPVCNYCQSKDPPNDSEYHLLRKENSEEVLNIKPKLCLPCNATCPSNNDGTTGATKNFQIYIIIIIAVGFLAVLMIIIWVVVYMKRSDMRQLLQGKRR